MSSNRRKFARLFLLFLAVVNSIALTIVVEQMPSHKPFQVSEVKSESIVGKDLSLGFIFMRFIIICGINLSVVELVINHFFSVNNLPTD